jgi:hypothetical protein
MSNRLSDLTIYDIESVLKQYLINEHPKDFNGFLIRLSNIMNNNFERRRSYIVSYPINSDTDDIINNWSIFAIEYIIEDYDITDVMNIVSIDPLKIENIKEIKIQYSGTYINPEGIIRNLTLDIIDQMNKHLIEQYMDENHPEIDINDSEDRENYNKVFDELDINDIYDKYKRADIYVIIKLKLNDDNKTFYLYGNILTNSKYNDIIDDIRNCLDTNDINEILIYDKEDIIYDFNSNNELESFNIIINKN